MSLGVVKISGHAIGKESRVVLAITDAGFAGKLSELLNEYNRG